MRFKARHVVFVKGGFYFKPTPKMREAGFRAQPLGTDQTKAFETAERLNAQWDAARRSEKPVQALHGTVDWLIALYQKSPEYRALADKTQYEFDRLAKLVSATFGRHMAAAIGRRHVKGYHRQQTGAVSQDHANRMVKTLRAILNVALDEELIQINPAARMRLKGYTPRDHVWEPKEVGKLIFAAYQLNRPSIALAVRMAYDLGQREVDVLKLTWAQWDGSHLLLRQRKTKKPLQVMATRSLKHSLIKAPRAGDAIIISEETGRPYTQYNFIHWFAQVREKAGLPSDKKFMDLRRTTAVRLAEAGATTAEFTAVTGHSIEHGAKIVEVYVPRNRKMADNAIRKLGGGTKVG